MPTNVILLEDAFDLATLPDGTYVTVQGTAAYPLLTGLVIGGMATLVGERFLENGKKAITVNFKHAGSTARKANAGGRIGIGREFFVTALRDYEDWTEKWWREAIQNAVDARATLIDCSVKEVPEGYLVRCTDNGGGMDEDTLLNKFLVLGGTTKTAEGGSTGGFGKAKELLLLPWISWKITSRDTVVEGAGVEYDVSKAPHYLSGVELAVLMPRGQSTQGKNAVNFIGKCTIPGVRFTVDGESVSARVNRGRQVESLEGKAEVWHNKSATHMGGMLIRINGLYMFNRWLDSSIPGTVFVELTGRSVDLLTANRDGIRDYELRRGLDAFASRLAKDTASALKGKKNLFTTRFEGEGLLTTAQALAARDDVAGAMMASAGEAKPKKAAKEGTVEVTEDMVLVLETMLGKFAGDGVPSIQEDKDTIDLGVAPVSLLSAFTNVIKNEVQYEHALKQLAWKPDFLVTNEEDGFKVPKKFLPEGMTPTTLKLAKVWAELCRLVLIQLGSRAKFGVGFVFSSGTAAQAATHDDEKWLLLNPYTKTKHMETSEIWNPNDDDDLKAMYAFAIHEATHVADGIDYHDESFSSALTFNIAKTVGGLAQARKIATGIKTRAPKGTKSAKRPAPGSSMGYEPKEDMKQYGVNTYAYRQAAEKALNNYSDQMFDARRALEDRDYDKHRTIMAAYKAFRDWLYNEDDSADPLPYMRWAAKAVPGAFIGLV